MKQDKQRILITGGAGFVGTHLAARLAANGQKVLVYDNLSRKGSKRNLTGLTQRYPQEIKPQIADVLDKRTLESSIQSADIVYHLASQDSATRDLADPTLSFEINVRGTLNVLEAIRKTHSSTALFFASSNQVGGLHGCTKAAAENYILEYARCFGTTASVIRMGCAYGPYQQGDRNQDWISDFVRKTLENETITIHGNANQTRDAIHIDDLIDALSLASSRSQELSGNVYMLGGGPENVLSPLDLLNQMRELHGSEPKVEFKHFPGSDPGFYISDIAPFSNITGWSPRTDVKTGIEGLYRWMQREQDKESRSSYQAGRKT